MRMRVEWGPAVTALSGAVVGAFSAWLIYLAKRKKDEPETATASAVRAAEAWAEYAERMERRLALAEETLDEARVALAECRAELLELKARYK